MHHSDDEDDFQSADEDGFGDEEQQGGRCKADLKQVTREGDQRPTSDEACATIKSSSNRVIQAYTVEPTIVQDDDEKNTTKEEHHKPSPTGKTGAKPSTLVDEDDEDEESLAERIRERNLKIARKFSAEIAKNNKASIPIPVKSPAPVGFKVSDIEYPSTPEPDSKSGLPPAPPPTPASSSSFSNLDEQQSSEIKNQYGWRILQSHKVIPTSQPDTPTRIVDPKGEQARLALDRLSEKLSQSDKNLFERVAADIKKVSIKSDDPPVPDAPPISSVLPSISDLGSTFGGWGWSGATKLLSSASQVTSHVGSVFDSVVNVSQHLQPDQAQQQQGANSEKDAVTEDREHQDRSTSPKDKNPDEIEKGVGETLSNEALVDFTLNAMESLGKKAFDVMTERDKSGSLQIKGLGRPWEHLLNLKKTTEPEQQGQQREDSPLDLVQESEDKFDYETLGSKPKIADDETHSSTLKNRKKHNSYDKLD